MGIRFSIISLLFPFTVNALSATTANVIQGSAPYLTFDGGTTKATTTDGLLSIQLSDGSTIKASSDTSSITPIVLPNASDTFASILTLVPVASYPTITLTDLINNHSTYWGDDDGDGSPTATGDLTIKWEDKNGDITSNVKNNPNGILSACNEPYKLTITATSGTLSTQYGLPPSSTFTGGNHTYYFKPKIAAPYACFAQPYLQMDYPGTGWVSGKGFQVQDVNTPSSNFPTTGSNNLFFLLTVVGATAQDVINSTGTTVFPILGNGATLTLTASSTNVVKVTLQGPKEPDGGTFSASTFEIKAGSTKIYSFELNKWFIPRAVVGASYAEALPFCNSLAGIYRIPTRTEYTNNSRIILPNCSGNGSDTGGTSCNGGTYTRAINGGLFSEWGKTNDNEYYPNTVWRKSQGYWSVEKYSSTEQYWVLTDDGYVEHYNKNHGYGLACVTP